MVNHYIVLYPSIAKAANLMECSGGMVFGTNATEQAHLNDAIAAAWRRLGTTTMVHAEADLAGMAEPDLARLAAPGPDDDFEADADRWPEAHKVLSDIYEG